MPESFSQYADVVVVGGRVAGASIAMLLARLGHDVVVVERASLPSDTVSTHQIARLGVVALHRWGVLDEVLAGGAPPLRQVTFHTGGTVTTRTVTTKSGVSHLVAPRRYVLDDILARAAVRAGATLRTGLAVAGVRVDRRGRATGVYGRARDGGRFEINARFVVGADGLSSRVAQSVGAELLEDAGTGGSTRYAYFAGLPWSGIEFFTAERGFAGVFPTNDAQACVWVCAPEADAREARRAGGSAEAALTAQLGRVAPDLAQRLRVARRTSPVQGMLRTPNRRRRASGRGWALIGDAALHHDPVSAHGISGAFRDAELLAVQLDRALQGDADDSTALAEYQTLHAVAVREVFDLTNALAAYPPMPDFVELMRQLGRSIDAEAATMAAQPVPGGQPSVRA